jgi:hypothetical protein
MVGTSWRNCSGCCVRGEALNDVSSPQNPGAALPLVIVAGRVLYCVSFRPGFSSANIAEGSLVSGSHKASSGSAVTYSEMRQAHPNSWNFSFNVKIFFYLSVHNSFWSRWTAILWFKRYWRKWRRTTCELQRREFFSVKIGPDPTRC